MACSDREDAGGLPSVLELRFRSFNQARNKPESWRNQHILELKNAVIPALLAIKKTWTAKANRVGSKEASLEVRNTDRKKEETMKKLKCTE